jgi:hypothetical protein
VVRPAARLRFTPMRTIRHAADANAVLRWLMRTQYSAGRRWPFGAAEPGFIACRPRYIKEPCYGFV